MDDPSKTLKPWVPLFVATAVALATAAAYAYHFGAYAAGPPSSWGIFGDFLGGVLNPAFGLITIYLLLANLLNERRSSADEKRRQEEDRDLHLHHHRLESALSWWQRRARREFFDIGIPGQEFLSLQRPVPLEELFWSDEVTKFLLDIYPKTGWPDAFIEQFRGDLDCLLEIAEYCEEADRIDEKRILSRYYRRRIVDGAAFFLYIEMVPEGYDAIRRLIAETPHALKPLLVRPSARSA